MTNEKAQHLEEMAKWKDLQGAHWKERSNAAYQSHPREKEAAMSFAEAAFAAAVLLREAAEMMRERGESDWTASFEREHKGRTLTITEARPGRWYWYVDAFPDYSANLADTLEAAQAAAVAWVDEQEGRDA